MSKREGNKGKGKGKGKEEEEGKEIQRIEIEVGGESEFYKNFIGGRMPCVVSVESTAALVGGNDTGKWRDVLYLKKHLAKEEVEVEIINLHNNLGGKDHDLINQFGLDRKQRMKFGDFIERILPSSSTSSSKIKKGKDADDDDDDETTLYYLTTQYKKKEADDLDLDLDDGDEEVNEEDHILSHPLDKLPRDGQPRKDFLLGGNLVLQQINVWIGGRSGRKVGGKAEETSSGLHHDFHDNFYLLLKGEKHFKIHPPSQSDKMYLSGKVERGFPNGLITYLGEDGSPSLIREDGAHLSDVATYNLQKAEERLALLEDDPASSKKDLEVAEGELEVALEEMAKYCADEDEFDKGEFDEEEEEDEEDEEEEFDQHKRKRDAASSKETTSKKALKMAEGEEDLNKLPPSFSKIPVSVLKDPSKLQKLFPNYLKATKMEFDLKEGEMLYLPTGWFHEVTSTVAAVEGYHFALNYWFAPPSIKGGDGTTCYKDNFWKEQL